MSCDIVFYIAKDVCTIEKCEFVFCYFIYYRIYSGIIMNYEVIYRIIVL